MDQCKACKCAKSHLRWNGPSSGVMFGQRDSCLPSDVSLPNLVQLSERRIDRVASIISIYRIKTRTLSGIHSQSAGRTCAMCALRSVSSVTLWSWQGELQACFSLLALSAKLKGPWLTGKAFHNASGALYTGKFTSRDTATVLGCFKKNKPFHNYLVNTVGNSGLSEVWERCWKF